VPELDAVRRAADAARGERDLAASAVALEHGAPHARGDAVRGRGRRRLTRTRHDALPLRVLREEEIETGLEDLLRRRARLRMRERVARRRDLREEALRDGDVIAAEVGGERLDFDRPQLRLRRRTADRSRRGGAGSSAAAAAGRTAVTTARRGGASTGRISATTSAASRFER